jgi:1,4-dihydroxy-2-naphthoate polyprenyltransferase
MAYWREVVATMRPNFMILTPLCVLLGAGAAKAAGVDLIVGDVVLIVVGAMLAHASVNWLNEYYDFKSGLDASTEKTPFSGGSGTLPDNPAAATATFYAGWLSFLAVCLIGLYFLFTAGYALLLLGLVGLLIIAAYTPWITRKPLLCLLAPGLGFGPIMVMGASFILMGRYSVTAFLISLVPLCFVSALLLINQFPDVEADQKVGRRHLPIVIGRQASARVYAGLIGGAFVAILALALLGVTPMLSAIAMLPVPAAIWLMRRTNQSAEDIAQLVPALGVNVAVTLSTLLLFNIGLYIGAAA